MDYSFYLFESSCDAGAGVGCWEHVEVWSTLPDLVTGVENHLWEGMWAPTLEGCDVLRVQAYQRGIMVVERNLHGFLTVKVPGLTLLSFDRKGHWIGGEPEPGGEYEGIGDELRELLRTDYGLIREARPDGITLCVDWAGLELPELVGPVPGEGDTVEDADERELVYGYNDLGI